MIVAKEMNSDFGKIPKGCHDYSSSQIRVICVLLLIKVHPHIAK